MQTLSIQKIILALIVLFSCMLISINWSHTNGLKISFVKSAYASVGQPTTPGNVAGAHKRAHRHGYHHHHHHHPYPYHHHHRHHHRHHHNYYHNY